MSKWKDELYVFFPFPPPFFLFPKIFGDWEERRLGDVGFSP